MKANDLSVNYALVTLKLNITNARSDNLKNIYILLSNIRQIICLEIIF